MTQHSSGSILVVEDDQGISTLERLRLERAGFQVETAASAEEAQSKLAQHAIEVLVLDNRLPGDVDGLAFYEHLQSLGHDVPVIMVTGFSDEQTAIRALKSGVRDFITKSPEFLDSLPTAVERVLKQVRTERVLAESEARYRRLHEHLRVLVEHMPAIFCTINQELRVTQAMGAGLAMLKQTPEDLKGRTLFEYFRTHDASFPPIAAARRVLQGEAASLELHWQERWLHLHLEPRRAPDGAVVVECLAVAVDITDQKQWQTHLMRSERLESLSTLAGGIAHDLNNVLTPIVMAIDLLKMHCAEGTSQTLLNTLQASAQRGADMVKQVLAYARGSQGHHQPFLVPPLLKELARLVSQTFPKSIVMQLKMPAELPLVAGDSTQILQLLMNLCVNARDAMPQGGRLLIKAEAVLSSQPPALARPGVKPGTYVALSVEDTGSGIPAEYLDKIFDPFFTTKGQGRQGQGTGLGLFNVAGIAKNHGGVLDLWSEVGTGTRFTVYLPAIDGSPATAAASARADLPQAHGEQMLVVDDEEAIREIMRATLEAAGYRVLTANNGAEALAVFAEHRRDIRVVIMDLMMPIMDGTAALRALYAIDPNVRAILASGYQKRPTLEIPVFVRAILAKPFSSQALLSTVREALENSGPNSTAS
jgi:signal transduction histidine kinase